MNRIAVIGAGPAGLMAAETLANAGHAVEVFDAMPSAGRKFLLAGKGGLNLTHSEAFEPFVGRYAQRAETLRPLLQAFGAEILRAWARGLGIETFVGSSGRVFPQGMKAAPLLRAWLHRLRARGVVFHMRHRWRGFAPDGALRFDTPRGELSVAPRATVFALGGASWPRLGSDGAWVPELASAGADIEPLKPSNCGFDVGWSEHFVQHQAGQPLKGVTLTFEGWHQAGEFIVTAGGVEGSLIYAASARLRECIASSAEATFHVDLLPARSLDWVQRELAHPRGPRSLSTHLKTRLNLHGVKSALLWERVPKAQMNEPAALAAAIKALPIRVTAPRPVAEAISTAGGVSFESLDERLMLRSRPGVFVAGEMLDWEAPTGGYLLTACFATGRAAGQGVADWIAAGQ